MLEFPDRSEVYFAKRTFLKRSPSNPEFHDEVLPRSGETHAGSSKLCAASYSASPVVDRCVDNIGDAAPRCRNVSDLDGEPGTALAVSAIGRVKTTLRRDQDNQEIAKALYLSCSRELRSPPPRPPLNDG